MDHIWSTCLYFKENEETTFEKQIPKLLGFRTVSQSLGGFAIQQRFVELDPFSGRQGVLDPTRVVVLYG